MEQSSALFVDSLVVSEIMHAFFVAGGLCPRTGPILSREACTAVFFGQEFTPFAPIFLFPGLERCSMQSLAA